MNLALIAATDKGRRLAENICRSLPGGETFRPVNGVRQMLEQLWQSHDGIVCIMAAGIVVRCLNGLVQSKHRDPCVIVLDENGSFVISLLSGHLGGGNELARRIARICCGTAVITTGSDVSGHTSIDLWSIEQNFAIINERRLAPVSGKLLNSGQLGMFQDRPYVKTLPGDFFFTKQRSEADIVVSCTPDSASDALQLLPRARYLGIGCRRGIALEEILDALHDLEALGLDLRSVAALASIDLKKDEKALLQLAEQQKWPIRFFPKEILEAVETPCRSERVYQKVGTHSVSEASAIRAATCAGIPGRMIIPKKKWKQITIAVAERVF